MCKTQHSIMSGLACIYQFNTKYFTAYVPTFFSILHYDLAHVFDFHLFSSNTSHSTYLIFPGIWRSQTFSLRDTPFFFSKISMPQKGSRSGLESGFKVIARCEALTALFPLRSSIQGGMDGRTDVLQVPSHFMSSFMTEASGEEQGIYMSRLLYLWQFYKGLLKRKNLWVCEDVSIFLLERPCSRRNKVTRGGILCYMCQQNFSRRSAKCI